MWYTNADTLHNKLPELRNRIKHAKSPPSIIAITEVKLKNTRHPLTEPEIKIDGFDLFTKNIEQSTGRGLALYVKPELKAYEVIPEVTYEEMLGIVVHLSNNLSMLVSCMYRSPSSTTENNLSLVEAIKEIDKTQTPLKIIVGDFNYPRLDWNTGMDTETSTEEVRFKEATLDCYLQQHVDFITRARGTDNPSCIDWVFTNDNMLLNNISPSSPLGKSDHVIVEADLNVEIPRKQSTFNKYYYEKGDYNNMRKFATTEFAKMTNTATNVNDMWNHFTDILKACRDEFIPHKVIKRGGGIKQNMPYESKIIQKIRKKHRCWQRYIETRSEQKFTEYRRLSNQVKNLTKKAKKHKERSIAKEAKCNPKKFWQYVNGKTRIRQGIPDLVYSGEDGEERSTTNDKEKAEVLSSFFTSVLTKENMQDIPDVPTQKVNAVLKDVKISKHSIRKKILSLNIAKSPGPDRVHPRLLKEIAEIILEPLEKMFNLSLQSSKMPEEWKIGEISAIFKKGNRRSPMNYRPISLTSIVCKILESLVREEIISHMRSNKLFSPYQYGFIDKRSTTLQLLYVLDKWTEIIDDGGTIDAIYMDFMKAFDKVPHERLLRKVEAYGISGPLLGWIRSFLTGRKQRVRVGEDSSKWTQVTSGIPQGSVLGPTLFVLYINDLPDSIRNNSTAVMFADDTKLFARTDTSKDKEKLQEDLDCVCKWSSLWLLKFHPDKCKVLSLGYKLDETPPTFNMVTNSEDGSANQVKLEATTCEKDIGVHVDDNLSFKDHIYTKIKKANAVMGIIRRTFDYLDQNMFLQLFKSLVRPLIETSVAVWAPYKKTDIAELERVQRRATKQVPGLKHLEYSERLIKIGLPTLVFRRLRGDMIEIFKIMAGIYDNEVTPTIPKGNEHTRGHQRKIFIRGARLNLRKNFFTVRVGQVWNKLPEEVVMTKDVNAFKRLLDKHWKEHPCRYDHTIDPYDLLAS